LIVPLGFTRVGTQVLFQKSLPDKIESINLSHSDYFPHSVLIQGVIVNICFPELIKLFEEVESKFTIDTFPNEIFRKSLVEIEGVNYKIFELEIKDDETFSVVSSEIVKVIEKGAFPFFEEFSTLEKIADFIAVKKPQDIVPFIQGAKLFVKAIMILKVANHPDYLKKRDEYYEVLKSQALKNPNYIPYQKAFEELFLKN
jgi:hypothetical protein